MCAWGACLNTVLRCSADACLLVPIFADHVGGLHVAMRFEWCVQAFPSGHVGPLATAGNKRRLGKGLHRRGGDHGRSSSKEVDVCLVHVMCYACADRLFTRAAYICRIHRSLQLSCYHGVARNWGAALPRCRCMPVCGVSVLFRLNICFGGTARLEHQISQKVSTYHTPLSMHLPVIGTIL